MKADIYALGIVYYEIITRKDPYVDMNSMRVGVSVLAGIRPLIPNYVPDTLVHHSNF